MRVELLFKRLRQHSTLMDYVVQFQLVEAAMVLAKVSISDLLKTLQFVKGIKDMNDRRFILEKAPKTLNDCYAAVLTLRL
eukprot:97878-Rhodomonas_salina.1